MNTITIDLASGHTGCDKMLRDLDLSDDSKGDGRDGGANCHDSKGSDRRISDRGGDDARGVGYGNQKEEKGSCGGDYEDDDQLDDLLDLMDAADSEAK